MIYKSKHFADFVYESIHEFTPLIKRGEAEFFFIANDPSDSLLEHLQKKGYQHYVNRNLRYTEEELFSMGYGKPEYIHRVYKGYNQGILHSKGEIVVLVNSDHYFSPNWLENLLKYSDRSKIVCSKLVERKHPKFGIFPGAYNGEFGDNLNNFEKNAFLQFAEKFGKTGLELGGAYMPCLFYKDMAFLAGLYPEGNIAGSTFDDVATYGDIAFFGRLAQLGVQHVTALDSIVYHLKEGENDDPDATDYVGESSIPIRNSNNVENKNIIIYAHSPQFKPIPFVITPTRDHDKIINCLMGKETLKTRTKISIKTVLKKYLPSFIYSFARRFKYLFNQR